MSAEGRVEMRRFAETVLADFLSLLESRLPDPTIDRATLHQVAAELLGSEGFAGQLASVHQRLLLATEMELLRRNRKDPFLRLLTHPFVGLFEDGTLSRDILVDYFSFLHLVLGDMRDSLATRCEKILEKLKGGDPLGFSWDVFYEDDGAKQVFWVVLVRIAESFRRFEARRDWFIGLMQNHPQAVSLGSNSFLPRHGMDDVLPFGLDEFNLLFGALFAPLRELSPGERLAFQRDFGGTVDHVLGNFFSELEDSGAVF